MFTGKFGRAFALMFLFGASSVPLALPAAAVTVEVHEVRKLDPVEMEQEIRDLRAALREQRAQVTRVTMACDGTKCAVSTHAPVKNMRTCEASITSGDTNSFCVRAGEDALEDFETIN